MDIDLNEMKPYLKVEPDVIEDDLLIADLIDTSIIYLENATGKTFDSTNKSYNLAKLFCKKFVADNYENRESSENKNIQISFVTKSILSQLRNR